MIKQAIFTVEVYVKGSPTLIGFITVPVAYSANTTSEELYKRLLQEVKGYTNQDIVIKITNSFVL